MAKGLPYFKFTPTEWLTGDISFESYEMQGFFISICALYWQRDGVLSTEDLVKRYKREDLINELSGRFFSVSDGFISVKFLDEQLLERGHKSMVNSENGKLGGRPKVLKTLDKKPNANRKQSEAKANESNIEEEKEEEVEKNKKKTLEEREANFATQLKPFVETYGREMMLKFYDYWREPNKSRSKMRFETEKTWDLGLRIKTWASRDKDFKPKNGTVNALSEPTKPKKTQEQIDREAWLRHKYEIALRDYRSHCAGWIKEEGLPYPTPPIRPSFIDPNEKF